MRLQKLQRYGNKNLTRVDLKNKEIYFSYETPVAIVIYCGKKETFITTENFSQTTNRHLNIVREENPVWTDVTQEQLEKIIEENL